MEILYQDTAVLVCVKPQGVRSTDEPGGLPSLVRQTLGNPNACVRTVHRLDQVVGGLMVLARTPAAAAELSRQIREQEFSKEYLAVLHGEILPESGQLRDLLLRNKQERKTYVVSAPAKDVQEAVLTYQVIDAASGFSKVKIHLETGRTHQIRVQFSSRGFPLVGDRKYSLLEDNCPIALWSYRLSFRHPETGNALSFQLPPPDIYPWTVFN